MNERLPIVATGDGSQSELTVPDGSYVPEGNVLSRARSRLRSISLVPAVHAVRVRARADLVGIYVSHAIGRYRQSAAGFPLTGLPPTITLEA